MTSNDPKRFWNALLPRIQAGRVVPVVGQDLLTVNGTEPARPLRTWLVDKVAEDTGVENRAGVETLNGLVCRYLEEHRGGLDEIYISIHKVLQANPVPPPAALVQLAEITAFKLYVSTTFDTLLLDAVTQARCAGRTPPHALAYALNAVVEDLPATLENLDRPVVYQLLGRVSPIKDTYAVTDEDVLEFIHNLQNPDTRPPRLFEALSKYDLLLIGNRFPDWLYRFFLRTVKSKERLWSVRDKTGFVADADGPDHSDYEQFLRYFSENTLVYSAGGAVQFVNELRQRWQPPAIPPSTTARAADASADAMPRRAVFLSYASEDRAIVAALKTKLDGAGVDAWFDRVELHGGDSWAVKLMTNIDACSLFVPIISRSVLQDGPREFRNEWERALEVQKRWPRQADGSAARFILPVVIDDTSMQAEGVGAYFGALQAVTLPKGEATQEFVDLVTQLFRKAQKSGSNS